jgi:hypothetical protein
MIAIVNDELSRDVAAKFEPQSHAFFMMKAAALMRDLLPVLDWLGTHKDFPLTIDAIRSAFELPWLRALVTQHLVLLQDRRSGEYRRFCVAREMPFDLWTPIREYVATNPNGDQAERQHQFL